MEFIDEEESDTEALLGKQFITQGVSFVSESSFEPHCVLNLYDLPKAID